MDFQPNTVPDLISAQIAANFWIKTLTTALIAAKKASGLKTTKRPLFFLYGENEDIADLLLDDINDELYI